MCKPGFAASLSPMLLVGRRPSVAAAACRAHASNWRLAIGWTCDEAAGTVGRTSDCSQNRAGSAEPTTTFCGVIFNLACCYGKQWSMAWVLHISVALLTAETASHCAAF